MTPGQRQQHYQGTRPMLFRHQPPSDADPSPVHSHRNGGSNGKAALANGDSPVRINMPRTDYNDRKGAWPGDQLDDEDDYYGGPNGTGEPMRPSAARRSRYPKEPLKTLAAAVYMGLCMISTAVALALVHEVRPVTAPLPDQILDRVLYQKWALEGSERLIQFQSVAAGAVVLFHRHRFIVLRRVMLVVGTLYWYRAVTMWVTALPSSDPEYECAPKLNGTITAGIVAERAFNILAGFGLSINGRHVYCGDFIFSGHTMSLIMGNLIVCECEFLPPSGGLP